MRGKEGVCAEDRHRASGAQTAFQLMMFKNFSPTTFFPVSQRKELPEDLLPFRHFPPARRSLLFD